MHNHIGVAGAESLGGVLVECTVLDHLDFSGNEIGPTTAESFGGVLMQCPARAHLDLHANIIGTVGEGSLRASWCGQVSVLVL